MKAKLVYELDNSRVRFYELSEYINTGISFGKKFNISEELKKLFEKIIREEYKEELRKYFTDDRGIKYIAISDAKTHTERLVFPAYPLKDVKYSFTILNIDGAHTYITQGGDIRTIKPDEVYIRHLARLNNLVYEGVVIEF